MALLLVVKLLLRNPMTSPVSLLVDVVLVVAIGLLGAYYRNTLPDKKVQLKEMMLFGLWSAVSAALVYALAVWAIGLTSSEQTILFTHTMAEKEITAADPQLHYWAAFWAMVAFVEEMVWGGLGAFFVALLLRNEKSEIKHTKRHGHIDSSTPAE